MTKLWQAKELTRKVDNEGPTLDWWQRQVAKAMMKDDKLVESQGEMRRKKFQGLMYVIFLPFPSNQCSKITQANQHRTRPFHKAMNTSIVILEIQPI